MLLFRKNTVSLRETEITIEIYFDGIHLQSKSYLELLIHNLIHLHVLYLIYKLVLFAAMMYDMVLSNWRVKYLRMIL